MMPSMTNIFRNIRECWHPRYAFEMAFAALIAVMLSISPVLTAHGSHLEPNNTVQAVECIDNHNGHQSDGSNHQTDMHVCHSASAGMATLAAEISIAVANEAGDRHRLVAAATSWIDPRLGPNLRPPIL